MGFLDKLLGREKKADDMTGDAPMRPEGMAEDRPAAAEESAQSQETPEHDAQRDN